MGIICFVFSLLEFFKMAARTQPNSAIRIPNVGVLCIDMASKLGEIYPDQHSYIPASYVKYLQSAGALVVPIW